jgi:TolB protein
VAWLAAALACAGVPDSELPEAPIAVSFYDSETQRRRVEALAEEAERGPRPDVPGVAVARVDDVADYLGSLLGGSRREEENVERRFPGRLALLGPRSGEVRPVEAARPSAIPRALSADRRRLLFSQMAPDRRQLFELDLETAEVRQVTRGRLVHPDGCYGPDGRLVLVRAEVEDGRPVSYLYLTEPGGTLPRRISEGPNDYGAACAPDGRAIVWVSHLGRGREFLMSRVPPVDGEVRRLGPGRDPAFSPDGEWVVYAAPVEGRWQLHRIRADGSGRKRVGQSTLDEGEPSFSPDGRLVVYVAGERGRGTLYLRRFDGSGDRVLLESGGGVSPVW